MAVEDNRVLINKEQFRQFLIDLGFTQGTGYRVMEDVMYGDIFGDTWVYFKWTRESTEERLSDWGWVYRVDSELIDVAQFVEIGMESDRKQRLASYDRPRD